MIRQYKTTQESKPCELLIDPVDFNLILNAAVSPDPG
jgi:hypothetical protein